MSGILDRREATMDRDELAPACQRCGAGLGRRAYELPTSSGRAPHCLRCAIQFRPMLKRSLAVCLIVGTLLTAINQGNFLLSGEIQAAMAWKIPLTYAVPFIVASIGALLNARASISEATDRPR